MDRDEQSAREAFGLDDDAADAARPIEARPSWDWLSVALLVLLVLSALACGLAGWSLGGR